MKYMGINGIFLASCGIVMDLSVKCPNILLCLIFFPKISSDMTSLWQSKAMLFLSRS